MEQVTINQLTLLVDASPNVIWRALTEPALMKHYRSGWQAQSTWKRGAELEWVERSEGQEIVRAKGTVMAAYENQRLRYTYYELDSGLPDEKASYITIDISITVERDGRSCIQLWQGDFAGLPQDVRRAREAGKQWVEALVGLKRISEEQQGMRTA